MNEELEREIEVARDEFLELIKNRRVLHHEIDAAARRLTDLQMRAKKIITDDPVTIAIRDQIQELKIVHERIERETVEIAKQLDEIEKKIIDSRPQGYDARDPYAEGLPIRTVAESYRDQRRFKDE